MKEVGIISEVYFKQPSLLELAYEKIKEDIILAKLVPGQKLVIGDLAAEFQISHTPIKEALNRLIAEGMVEALPRKGMRVRKISLKDIEEILDLRIMCEKHVAGRIIQQIKDNKVFITKLKDILRRYSELKDTDDFKDYRNHVKLESEFHSTIISLSGNKRLIDFYNSLKAFQYTFNVYAVENLGVMGRYENTLIEHNEILEMLINEDENKLIESFEKHIKNVKEDLFKKFQTINDIKN